MSFKEMLEQPLPSQRKPLICVEVVFLDDGNMIFMEDTAIETDIPKVGTVKFAVYHEDTAVPHFHVFNKQTDKQKRINVCFKFDVGEYFLHGVHDTPLNNQQLAKLQKALEKPLKTKDDPNRLEPLWNILQDIWNRSASDKNKSMAEHIPDYRTANN